jgi:hypothetical protein
LTRNCLRSKTDTKTVLWERLPRIKVIKRCWNWQVTHPKFWPCRVNPMRVV